MKLRVVTNSELKTRRRCAMEHHLAYDLGIRPVDDDAEALSFGRTWHMAMEDWWGCAYHGKGALESALEAIDVAIGREGDPYARAKLRALVYGYNARWLDETDFGAVVAVEREFRAPLTNPETGAPSRTYELGGKVDVLLGRRFVEHKTTSEDIGMGSVYWRMLTLDSQVSTYYAGVKSLGHEVDGCLYDVVRKPALRPSQIALTDSEDVKIVLGRNGERVRTKDNKKWRQTGDAELGYTLQTRTETPEEFEQRLLEEIAANPDKYFQRGEVVRLEAEERAAALDTWQLTRAMAEDARLGRHPRNADACRRYGRMCSYFDACTGAASLDDASRFVRVENVHQELSADAAE